MRMPDRRQPPAVRALERADDGSALRRAASTGGSCACGSAIQRAAASSAIGCVTAVGHLGDPAQPLRRIAAADRRARLHGAALRRGLQRRPHPHRRQGGAAERRRQRARLHGRQPRLLRPAASIVPTRRRGKELIAHELTHTVQQGASAAARRRSSARRRSRGGKSVVDFCEDFGWGIVRRISPSLEPIIRNGAAGVFDWLKTKVAGARSNGSSRRVTAPVRAIAGVGDRLVAHLRPAGRGDPGGGGEDRAERLHADPRSGARRSSRPR